MIAALASIVALMLLPFVVLHRAARRVNWLAVASDLLMLACAAMLVFAFWIATSIFFVIGA